MKSVLRSTISTTTIYFDRTPLVNQLTYKERRFLQQSGSLVASTARRLIVKRNRKSKPGEPPISRTGKLRQMIRFGVDSSRVCAVAGALPLLASESHGEAPGTLEYGGIEKKKAPRSKKVGDRAAIRIEKTPYSEVVVGQHGKKTHVVFAKIKTPAQAAKAKQIEKEIYGDKSVAVIAARPYMNAALRLSQNRINDFLR